MFDVVVVGADDSLTARRAVEAAVEIARMSNGVLHLVSVFDLKTYSGRDLPAEFHVLSNEGEVDALLQELSLMAKGAGVEFHLHGVNGSPADALIKVAEDVNADLLVVGNKGMKGLRRVLGSVPNTIAHEAPCSVAIIDTTE